MASKFLRDAAKQAYRQWIQPWTPSRLARRRIHARAIRNVKYSSSLVTMPTKKDYKTWWKQMHGKKIAGTKTRRKGYLTPTMLYDILTGKQTHIRSMGHYYKTGSYNLPHDEAKRIVVMVARAKGIPKNTGLAGFATHKKRPMKANWLGVKRAISAQSRKEMRMKTKRGEVRRGLKRYQARILRQELGGKRIGFGEAQSHYKDIYQPVHRRPVKWYLRGERGMWDRQSGLPKARLEPKRYSHYRRDRLSSIARAKYDYLNTDVPRMKFAAGLAPGLGVAGYMGHRRYKNTTRKGSHNHSLRKWSFKETYNSTKRTLRRILLATFAVAGVGGLLYALKNTGGDGVVVSSRNVPSRRDSKMAIRQKINNIVEESNPTIGATNKIATNVMASKEGARDRDLREVRDRLGVTSEKARSVRIRRERLMNMHRAKRNLFEDTKGKYGDEANLLDDDDDRDIKRLMEGHMANITSRRHRLEE